MADNPLNAVNRGVYISDNLPFLKSLNDGCIDLVCIDPPFAKNETFGRKNEKSPDPLKPPLTRDEEQAELDLLKRWGINSPAEATAKGIDWPETAYKDFWSWQRDVHSEWIRDIEDDHPGVHKLIEATREIHSDATAAYLCYMAVRLFEIRRVLRDTGSLYLHCDHTAGAYLRQLLDAIFGNGADNGPGFRNEINWRSTTAHSDSKRFGANTETILFYSRSEHWHWQKLFQDYDAKHLARFRFKDADGRLWQDDNLTAKGLSGGGYRYEYKGVDSLWRVPISTMEELDRQGRLHFTSTGGIRRKRYLDESQGRPVQQLWDDINPLNSQSAERTGYPTQKPVALAERIIRASCPEGGVVLDCFAGCAYVAVAAERLGRCWVACDINPRAWTVFARQFDKPKLVRLRCAEPAYNHRGRQASFLDETVYVYGPEELPMDTIRIDADLPSPLPVPPASIFTKDEMLEALLDLSDYESWCCGFANRMSNGDVVRTLNNFHLDHLDPKSKGGDDEIFNRVPMCPHHNTRKNTRRVYLDDYRQEIADSGELLVANVADLVDLRWAAGQVREIWFRKRAALPSQMDFRGRTYVLRK
ncbi:MAG: DNA methyltransferase [Chloroflexota bacterium]|nr:DNA methyltransferase [Chloroflexota bacterium]MDE2960564.1 DNA methyltransferase [Chloroflexota bacterium]